MVPHDAWPEGLSDEEVTELWKDPPCSMGKLTISYYFNRYVKLPEGNHLVGGLDFVFVDILGIKNPTD